MKGGVFDAIFKVFSADSKFSRLLCEPTWDRDKQKKIALQ